MHRIRVLTAARRAAVVSRPWPTLTSSLACSFSTSPPPPSPHDSDTSGGEAEHGPAAFELYNAPLLFGLPSSLTRLKARVSVLVTCEHASQALPPGYHWSAADQQRLVDTHWAYDIGAADAAKLLCEAIDAPGVASCFSRLLVCLKLTSISSGARYLLTSFDPPPCNHPWADDCCWLGRVVGRQIDVNRPLTDQGSGQVHPTLVRSVADNLPVDLNRNVSNDEIQRRIAQFYAPYHSAISTVVSSYRPRLLISMHSFNSVYEGQKRDIEIGVLCNENAYPADAVCAASTTASIVPTAVTVGDNTSRRDRGVNQLAVG
jgi:predicted N-formylglutamate amidohydrolase